MTSIYDVAIIGGGINGCGCAADAALRGLSVVLCEQDDLASKTSSGSTKLIHGGLRYLEYYDFGMVKKALDERQILLEQAPYLIHPLPLVLPHKKHMRPAWLLRTGLYLYDHLSRNNTLPNTQTLKRSRQPMYFTPLKEMIQKGFLFYDACTDDARLVLANALQAKAHGAELLTRTTLIGAEVQNGHWTLSLQASTGNITHIQAKSVINAAGPWVQSVNELLKQSSVCEQTLVKGSHIVVPKLYTGHHAYVLQHEDKRIVFVIPYHGHTMIGTTDVLFTGTPDNVKIETDEIDYLLALVNQYFTHTLTSADIIHHWSAVRPLLSEAGKPPRAISRDYAFDYQSQPAPTVTLCSGKLTTYRQLAMYAVDLLEAIFKDLPPSRTASTPLPGSQFNTMNFTQYQAYAKETYHWLEQTTLERYLKTYGTRTEQLLKSCQTRTDLGQHFGQGLYQIEIEFLIQEEWAETLEDILWRRTKLGLLLDRDQIDILNSYFLNIESKDVKL